MKKRLNMVARAVFAAGVAGSMLYGTAQAVDIQRSDCPADPPTYPGASCLQDEHCEWPCRFYDGWWWACEEGCCLCAV
jgi:hypothetical protein